MVEDVSPGQETFVGEHLPPLSAAEANGGYVVVPLRAEEELSLIHI